MKERNPKKEMHMRLPGVEPGSIAWKAIILTVGLQTLLGFLLFYFKLYFYASFDLFWASPRGEGAEHKLSTCKGVI